MAIALAILLIVLLVVIYDLLQKRHAILRSFPLIGHFRYLLEAVGPELRQYIVTGNDEERPFSLLVDCVEVDVEARAPVVSEQVRLDGEVHDPLQRFEPGFFWRQAVSHRLDHQEAGAGLEVGFAAAGAATRADVGVDVESGASFLVVG